MLYLFKDKSKCVNRYAKKRRRNKENASDVQCSKTRGVIYVASVKVKYLLKLIIVLLF
jgi:hypothetical protein